MSVNELSRIDEWLTTLLATDATLTSLAPGGVWEGAAPSETVIQQKNGGLPPYPVVVYTLAPAADTLAMGGNRILANARATVKAITDGRGYPTAAADRIDQLLQNASGDGTTSGGLAVIVCIRESPVRLVETDEATWYRHLGGVFAICIESA